MVTGYERLVEIYGVKEVDRMITLYSQIDRRLRITTFRGYRISGTQREAPSAMYTMNDIVLEVTLDEKRGHINVRTVKALHIRKPITISRAELEYAVEVLKKKIQAITTTRK